MTCQEFVELVTDLIEDQLAGADPRARSRRTSASATAALHYLEQIGLTICRRSAQIPEESRGLRPAAREQALAERSAS